MNNISKNIIRIACTLAITGSAVAQTPVDLIDDNFTAPGAAALSANSRIRNTQADGTFYTDNSPTSKWIITGAAGLEHLSNDGSTTDSATEGALSQLVATTGLATDLGGLTLSFDYTVGATATLKFALIGYKANLQDGGGTSDVLMNNGTANGNIQNDTQAELRYGDINLLTGADMTQTITEDLTFASGTSGSHSVTIDLTAYAWHADEAAGASPTNAPGLSGSIASIADFDFVALVALIENSTEVGATVTTLDNIKLTAEGAPVTPATPGTWDGETDTNWNTNTNWETDLLPISTDVLTFTGTANTATNNDIVAGSEFAGISFTNTLDTQSFTLAGNSIILGGDISQSAAITGSISDTISLNMELNGDRTVDSGAGHNLDISGIISEDGSARSLTKDGAGTLTLSGANTYTGGASIEGGSVQLSNVNGLGTGTVSLADSSATLVLSDGISIGNAFTVSDTGDEKVLQLESGTTNTGSYSGAIAVNETTNGNFQLDAGGTDSGNANTNDDLYTQILDITGDITSTAGNGLNIIGDGVVRLSGDNDITGTIDISNRGSKLRVGHNNALGTADVLINNRKAELQLEDGITIANNLTFTGASNVSKQITVDDGNALVAESATATGTILLQETSALAVEFVAQELDTLTLSGVISGGAGNDWQKLGAGTVILTATNDYLGLTTVTEGTLQLGDGTSGNDGVIVGDIVNDSDLTFNTFGAGSYAGGITGTGSVTKIGAGTQTLSGALQLGTAQQQFNVTSNGDAAPELTISGGIGADGENDLIKNGTGTLLLTGDNSAGVVVIGGVGDADFDGINRVRIKEGVVQIQQANNLGDNSIFISDGATVGTLEFVGSSAAIIQNEIALRGNAGTNTILRASGTTMAAAVEYSYGNPGGAGDTLTLDGANTGLNTIGFDLNANGNNLSGGLTKDGAGTWVLKVGVAQTYTGDTTVTDGTLVLNEADLYDGSTVTVGAGAVLQLDHSDTDVVTALNFGLSPQGDGIYNAANSGGFITGTGSIEVDSTVSNYSTWATTNSVTGGISGDSDGDGNLNIIEYALDILIDGYEAPGTLTGNTISYSKRAEAVTNGDVLYSIESSEDLGDTDPWAPVTPTTDTATEITYTFTPGTPVKEFYRLSVVTAP